MSNALVFTSPSTDRHTADKKQRAWTKFINSLDWDKLTKKHEAPDPHALVSVFGKLGVPTTGAKKGGKK